MISYSVYKVMHLMGVMMVFIALGGATLMSISGAKEHSWRKPVAITHGIGMLFALVAGFGLLARLGVMHGSMPGWAMAKLGIWLVFGALLSVVIRQPQRAKVLWAFTILLGGTAAYIAGYKPF